MDAGTLQLHTPRPPRPMRLLTPLALYAALSAALAGIFAVPLDALALLCGAAVLALGVLLPRRASLTVRLVAACGAVLALALLPAVRGGALALVNRLYAASEAANAYAYEYFDVSGGGGERAALLAAAVLLGALCLEVCRRRAAAVALFLGVAFLEAYFGVTPGLWRSLALFAALALPLAYGEREAGSAATLLAGAAAVALAVCLLAPRPIAAVEARSERLRDELGVAAMRVISTAPPEAEPDRTRLESRQRKEMANADASDERDRREFERRTETERELSLPHRVDYLRAALLLLAVAALLTVPFAPFLLLDRARRRAAERRAAFADADNAAAIRAMFAHTMAWLRACGLETENRPFSRCAGAVEALTSPEYAAQYAEAVSLWQEAAYSGHKMDEDQRAAVRRLLDTTEKTLYERADRRKKFRLKYIDCLCGGKI